MALSIEQVAEHIHRDQSVAMVPLGTLLGDTAEQCVDGRSPVGGIGTPGGNAGEFVTALTAAENAANRPVDDDMIVVNEGGKSMFELYLDAFGFFYMHTDSHALEQLGVDEGTLRKPNGFEADLIEKLTKPEYTGCGHLRLMMQFPERYQVRRVVVAAVIEAFYRRLWSHEDDGRLDLVVLHGKHEEGAVVNIVLDEPDITAHTMIPTIAPTVDGEQMFVNHPQAALFLRVESARHISEVAGFKVNRERYLAEIHRLAKLQLTETLKRLAPNLPVYNAYFRDGRLDRVEVA